MQNYSDLNQVFLDSGKPYTDLEVTEDYTLRQFNESIDPIELLWHRDNEDRVVEIIGKTDWKLQLDNSLPTSLQERIFIPRHKWHRVIKGTGVLNLKIYKDETNVIVLIVSVKSLVVAHVVIVKKKLKNG